MKQIRIGTCVPGEKALDMIPGMKQYGFEAFAVCFDHLTKNMDLTALAPRVMA